MSRSNDRLDRLIWICIYAGLLAMGLGLAVWGDASGWSLTLVVGGAGAAVVGFALIGVRARRPDR